MNYFELFDIPVSLMTDKNLLSERYINLQKEFHPDYFGMTDDASKEQALEMSSTLNKAYKLLQDKDKTLAYILELKGTLTSNEKYNLPPDFLMEVMELNEDLDEKKIEEVKHLQDIISEPVNHLLSNYQHDTVTAEELASLKEYYFKKKYLQRILDRIEG